MIIAKITAIVFAALLLVSFMIWGAQGVVNFFASFMAFTLVAVATFFGYKKVVLSSKPDECSIEEPKEEEEEKPSKISLLTKTYKGWLFPLRLISYMVFVLVFLYFANNGTLDVLPFLMGISALPLSMLIFIFFFRREF